MTMTRDAIEAMFTRRREAYDRQDAAALARDYAADCIIESPSGGVHHGPAAAEQVLRTVFDALDIKVRDELLLIDGDCVAQVVNVEGTDSGQFLGLQPTGKSFRMPAVLVYELKDGLIARERRIYDFTGVLVQVGLFKAKPGG
jgi:predicted ester cyclase